MTKPTITATSYDSTSRTLKVTYPSGVTYCYAKVPAHVAAAFGRAESKGMFMGKYIRGKYEATPQPAANSEETP